MSTTYTSSLDTDELWLMLIDPSGTHPVLKEHMDCAKILPQNGRLVPICFFFYENFVTNGQKAT